LYRCVRVIDRVAEPPIIQAPAAFGGVITAASGSAAGTEGDIAPSLPAAGIAAASLAVTTALAQVGSEAEWAGEAFVVEASLVAQAEEASTAVVAASMVVAEEASAVAVAAASTAVVAAAADTANHQLLGFLPAAYFAAATAPCAAFSMREATACGCDT
jgi:hypothetical protein